MDGHSNILEITVKLHFSDWRKWIKSVLRPLHVFTTFKNPVLKYFFPYQPTTQYPLMNRRQNTIIFWKCIKKKNWNITLTSIQTFCCWTRNSSGASKFSWSSLMSHIFKVKLLTRFHINKYKSLKWHKLFLELIVHPNWGILGGLGKTWSKPWWSLWLSS